jgi:hypothetical protein
MVNPPNILLVLLYACLYYLVNFGNIEDIGEVEAREGWKLKIRRPWSSLKFCEKERYCPGNILK